MYFLSQKTKIKTKNRCSKYAEHFSVDKWRGVYVISQIFPKAIKTLDFSFLGTILY